MRIVAAPLTLEQYLALPDDGLQYEVVEGQPVVNPAPARRHQRVLGHLHHVLADACPAGLEVLASPLDWVLWERPALQIRQPDLVVAAVDDEPRLTSAPLLAVEVLSPGSSERDLVHKRNEYGRAGLRHYWVVDPDEPSIVVYEAAGDGVLRERQRATGDEALVIDRPLAVQVNPTALGRA